VVREHDSDSACFGLAHQPQRDRTCDGVEVQDVGALLVEDVSECGGGLRITVTV
jgi:hypothetical protein